jgi:hypothetical protein
VKDSAHFIEILKSTKATADDLLVSFDVVSLFTNIPIGEAMAIIRKLMGEDLPKDFADLTEFCLKNSYFTWDNSFYEQTEGSAMGSPISPVVANIFMEEFERKALSSAAKKPSLWLRYVDDTFVIWPHGRPDLDRFLEHLNGQHPSIQFTMETEENGRIPFLDVMVEKKTDGSFGHSVYRKKTHTDRYLHAASHHHPSQKAGLIKTLVHRAKTISDQDSIRREKDHLVEALHKNGYRKELVLNRTLWNDNKDKEKESKEGPPQEKPAAYAAVPYVAGTTERIARILTKHNVKTRFTCCVKTGDHLPKPKDKIPRVLHEGVYQLQCSCGKSYTGQTGRSIKTRIREHERATEKKQFRLSAVSEHVWSEPEHTVDFEKPKVICYESRYYPRIIREAIEITKQPDNFNREDSYTLANTWKRLFVGPKDNPSANQSEPT